MRGLLLAILVIPVLAMVGCRSKSDIKRDQELERLKLELNSVRGEKADASYATDELRQEMARLTSIVEENSQLAQRRFEESVKREEELRKEMGALQGRLEMMEGRELEIPPPKAEPEKKSIRLDTGKKLLDAGKYAEAAEVLKEVAMNRSRAEEAKRAQFLLGEAYFELKDYASAALEFSEFKKSYPKDGQVPSAIYRQANCFRLINRPKEAKLFYQELLDKFPKHVLASKAREELKKIK
ncbi:MAG: tetratricopeptide repeat protein [Deltaproteobacteria bacterium]|nr:tetratricopeptide repeat protein [Deltaproteobacteria bacterium]MBI3296123.1 tetratricopeptide repeat protein [Deltaproteobacteria bacterium]